MKILKNQVVTVVDSRKSPSKFQAHAYEDFDTDDEWYKLITNENLYGASTDWVVGEKIPARKGITDIITEESKGE